MEKNKNFDEFIENDKKKLINLTQEDLLNIPIDVIQKQTKDLSIYNTHKIFGNPLSGNIGKENCLLEGITKSYPLASVKKHIIKKYKPSFTYKALPEHIKQILGETDWLLKISSSSINAFNSVVSYYDLEEWQFNIITNDDGTQTHITILIPNINDNILLMDETMVCFGYYRSCNLDVKTIFPQVKNMDMWVILQYEQRIQSFVNDKIREEKYLYHISPSSLEHKILKNGLIPKSKNDKFNFPDRVYLLKGSLTDVNFDLQNVAEMLYSSKNIHISNDYIKENEYTFYRIDVSKISSNTNFSIDYNFFPLSIFSVDNISPFAIEVINHYLIKTYKK